MLPGISFSPLNAPMGPQDGTAQSPLQDAIKILSFRMPSVVGAGAASPLAGGMGGGLVDDWLTKLFKGMVSGPQGGLPAAPTDQTPPPSLTQPSPFAPPPSVAPPPSFTGNVPPPGPPPSSAPPPNVEFTPPGVPKLGLPAAPAAPEDQPLFGGHNWRDWLGGTGRNQF